MGQNAQVIRLYGIPKGLMQVRLFLMLYRLQKAREMDVLICDTAGRLHTKKNLMNELSKINRIIEQEYPDAQKRSPVGVGVLTTGQNAISQARFF